VKGKLSKKIIEDMDMSMNVWPEKINKSNRLSPRIKRGEGLNTIANTQSTLI
jgi:hypothetical protein